VRAGVRLIADVSMERAIRAWTRRHSGAWLDADEAELQAWLAAANEHREAFERLARAWTAAGDLKRPLIADRPGARKEGSNTAKPPHALQETNCCGSVCCRAGGSTHRTSLAFRISLVERSTGSFDYPEGATAGIRSGDGTKVLLDADSELVHNIGPRARRLSLTRGEALFTVSHDARGPSKSRRAPGGLRTWALDSTSKRCRVPPALRFSKGGLACRRPRGEALLVAGQAGGYDNLGNLTLPQRAVYGTAEQWSSRPATF